MTAERLRLPARRMARSTAARGAQWVTVGVALVGVLNYGYALLLTHLLNVSEYARFAAGQSLILWAMNAAVVSIPWVLAQSLARATSDQERAMATRFAKLATTVSGLVAGAVVGGIATQFAGPATVAVLAASTFLLFLSTTTTGWLMGHQRMASMAGLYIAETTLKNAAGVLLVVTAGLGATGALAAFGIGALAILVRWPRTPQPAEPRTEAGRLRQSVFGSRDLWRQAGLIAGAQTFVSLFVAVDVVMVAILPETRSLAASYQASATLTRVPMYLAVAIGTAFFPALSRARTTSAGGRDAPGRLAAQALGMYTAVGLPIAIIFGTAPGQVLALVFPAQYGEVAELLKFTAVTGFAAGAISLITAFFQAADDYGCLRWLAVGFAGYVAGLVAGYRIDGITGLAASSAAGAGFALLLMICRLVRRQGLHAVGGLPFLTPLLTAAVLVALRPHPHLWLAGAVIVGVLAVARFLRPAYVPVHAARMQAPVTYVPAHAATTLTPRAATATSYPGGSRKSA